jgi:hypothetical protein
MAVAYDDATSFESRERATLAAAIARHNQLSAHLDDIRQRTANDKALLAALSDRDAAEAALADAERDARAHALARAMGEPAGPSVTLAQADLDAARQRFVAVQADAELVRAEIDRLARAVANTHEALQQAIGAVLAASPGWAALLAELSSARQRVMVLENTIADLHKLPAVHLPQDWSTPAIRTRPEHYLPDPALAALWRAVIAALTADASAPIPGGDPAQQPVAA